MGHNCRERSGPGRAHGLIAGVDASGIRSNRLLYGDIAWNKRGVALRAQNLAGQATSSTMTPEQVAGFLGVDKIMISRERYQSAAATKSKVTPDIVLEFYAEDGQGIDDPSNSKRFWTACRGVAGCSRFISVRTKSSRM
jgi:hypothetical protein